MGELGRTFSELWYRVQDFAPRLTPHLSVRRQTYRDETWFVIGDPASSKFYRFNASAYRFLGLLDGNTTVQQAWDVCNAQLGDDAPTQRECLDLLARLQQFGLLRGDLPVDSQRLRERYEEIRERRFQQLTGKFVFWTLPIFNPEKFLAKFANVARVVYSRGGFIALLAMILIALRLVIPRWDELSSSLNNVIAPQNIFWLSLVFLLLKVVHELGHGFSCKAYGGRVTEIGVMFMIVLPIPYCDASSSWAFTSKWKRILVAAAGVMTEVFFACIASIVWSFTEPGLVHTLAFNVMFVASIATVLFNANPLLRYDGYYILSDLTEIPNLAQRAHELLKWMARRYLFGLKGEAPPPLHGRGEAAIMIAHATLAFPYRILVMIGIVMFVAQQYFIIGFVLGVMGGLVWFVWPTIKGVSYVLSDPSLEVVRARAVGVTFSLVTAIILLIGVVPMPATVHAIAVVEPSRQQTIRALRPGFVTDIAAQSGMIVDEGEVILTLENHQIDRQRAHAGARLAIERARFDLAASRSAAERLATAPAVDVARDYYELTSRAQAELTIRAPFTGRLIAPEIDTMDGGFVNRGDPLAIVSTLDDLVIRAYIPDRDFAWLFKSGEPPRAQIKVRGHSSHTWDASIERVAPAGVNQIRHESVTQMIEGGEVLVDPDSSPQGAPRTLDPQYEVTLNFPGNIDLIDANGDPLILPGTRARVRLSTESEPLVSQWYRRLRQAFAVRFEI